MSISTRVVIIGGGATGIGIARDAAERGFEVILIEREDLGSGTSGHFHGMLHSGARYAVNNPTIATECFTENQILRQIVPSAITDTGGLFLALDDEDSLHADTLIEACLKSGMPVSELTVQQAILAEPHITRSLKRAFVVPDGSIDGTELLRLNRHAAMQAEVPATFMTDHVVVGFQKNADAISAVSVRDAKTGNVTEVECDYVINAAGVWAGQITAYASIELPMIFDKGTMMVYREQFSHAVLNRCRPESDGDLLVPHGNQSIMGTTARTITDPNDCFPTQEEVDVLLREGAAMVPRLRDAEVVRMYAGVRPLLSDKDAPVGDSRSISRTFRVVDHASQGVANFISVVGGKVTLYRRMAEVTVDVLCAKSGSDAKSTTANAVITA